MTSVCLSYARNEDDAFVARLYAFLRERQFDVWWDVKSMPNRTLTFMDSIVQALVAKALGGVPVVDDLYGAIESVLRWWP
jgi:hypothetical protein